MQEEHFQAIKSYFFMKYFYFKLVITALQLLSVPFVFNSSVFVIRAAHG